MNRKQLKKQVNFTLLTATVLITISGLGIIYPGIVTPLTLGLLDKLTSYRVHLILWGPFTILFILHLALNVVPRGWFERSEPDFLKKED